MPRPTIKGEFIFILKGWSLCLRQVALDSALFQQQCFQIERHSNQRDPKDLCETQHNLVTSHEKNTK